MLLKKLLRNRCHFDRTQLFHRFLVPSFLSSTLSLVTKCVSKIVLMTKPPVYLGRIEEKNTINIKCNIVLNFLFDLRELSIEVFVGAFERNKFSTIFTSRGTH